MFTTLAAAWIIQGVLIAQADSVADWWYFSGPNVAKGQRCEQYPGTYKSKTASLAVDGDMSTFSHTDPLENSIAWWRVELERPLVVKGIRIYHRPDFTYRFENFKVREPTLNITFYDDKTAEPQLFKKYPVDIKVAEKRHVNSVEISVPEHKGYPEEGLSMVHFTEVQIFPVLCERPSEGGNWSLKDRITSNTGFAIDNFVTAGSVLEFWCEPVGRQKLIGGEPLKCMENGRFNGSLPACAEVCLQPPRIEHGMYLSSKPIYAIGETAAWTCDTNFNPANGSRPLVCADGGTWSKPYPACFPITCSHPGDIPHGYYLLPNGSRYESDSVSIGTTISVRWDDSPSTMTSNLTVTCGDLGQWLGENMTCVSAKGTPSLDTWHVVLLSCVGVTTAISILLGVTVAKLKISHRRQAPLGINQRYSAYKAGEELVCLEEAEAVNEHDTY